MTDFADALQGWACPGPAFTRPARQVTGKSGTFSWEWQWAQSAMFAHYALYMYRTHAFALVISEREYLTLSTGIDIADRFMEEMSVNFRNFRKRNGGRLRPDILGFCADQENPSANGVGWGTKLGVELLEVTTVGQAAKTLVEDVAKKLDLCGKLATDAERAAQIGFQSPKISYDIHPSKWKPKGLECIVPLPLTIDAEGNPKVEWICFNPTYRPNGGKGIDGLLLYEIHSVPIVRANRAVMAMLDQVAKKIDVQEREARRVQRIVDGLLPVPWLTQKQIPKFFTPDEELLILGAIGLVGVGLLAYVAAPIIAGLSVEELVVGLFGRAVQAVEAAPATSQPVFSPILARGSLALEKILEGSAANDVAVNATQVAEAAAIFLGINSLSNQWGQVFDARRREMTL